MPAVGLPGKNLPLPVQLFSAAMEQQVSLAAYASHVGLEIERMYEALTTQPNELQADMLESLARTYHQPADALRSTPAVPSLDETFGAWLKRNMEGVSQHALRKRAQIETRELKEILNETTLPDSDQAERLARALYINRTEVARTIVADMLRRARQDRQASMLAASQGRAMATEQSPARTRRRIAPQGQAQQAATPAAIEHPSDMALPKSKPAKPGRARLQLAMPATSNGAEAPNLTAGRLTESEPAAQRRAAPPEEATPETKSDTPAAALVVAEQAPASGALPADKPALPATNIRVLELASGANQSQEVAGVVQPVLQVEPLLPEMKSQRRARVEQAGNGAFSKPGLMQARSVAAALDGSEAKTVSDTNTPQRASAAASTLAGAAAPLQPPNTQSIATPEQEEITSPARAVRPKKASSQAGRSSHTQADPAELAAGSGAAAETSGPAAGPAADQALAQAIAGPKRALTATEAQAKQAPMHTHEAGNRPTIQLSEEESRLLRRWRQLHPQGRRATLLYIASLLLEE